MITHGYLNQLSTWTWGVCSHEFIKKLEVFFSAWAIKKLIRELWRPAVVICWCVFYLHKLKFPHMTLNKGRKSFCLFCWWFDNKFYSSAYKLRSFRTNTFNSYFWLVNWVKIVSKKLKFFTSNFHNQMRSCKIKSTLINAFIFCGNWNQKQ